ncbi:MAG: LapD/MoxY N-terminal periplasmic domain-containing protein [Venatoribacter sp.]
MSLTKQLWIAILLIISLTFISGFSISAFNARNSYEEQLKVKNIDNAASMALTLSSGDKDLTLIELMLNSQFNSGHYKRIHLVDANGTTLLLLENITKEEKIPAWFERVINFDIPAGVAQVQDGWNLYGTLYVESQSEYALVALWRIFYLLLLGYGLIALLCGLVGTVLMRLVNQPLSVVVTQAEALGERQFITTQEPKTMEFRRLVRAMNRLTNRVRSMLEAESKNIEEIRQKSMIDEVTGVWNRAYLLDAFKARLKSTENIEDGFMVLRLIDILGLNQKLGRQQVDALLKKLVAQINSTLESLTDDYSRYFVGRLNGTDFAILFEDTNQLAEIAEILVKDLSKNIQGVPLICAAGNYRNGDEFSRFMTLIDSHLADLEEGNSQILSLIESSQDNVIFDSLAAWKAGISEAIEHHRVSFDCYPNITMKNQLWHQEAMLRIELNGKLYSAGHVIGWTRRAGLLPDLELKIIDLALQYVAEARSNIAVNISMASLADVSSYSRLIEKIQGANRDDLKFLSLELDESVALKEPVLFASFVAMMKRAGVAVGLQAVTSQFSRIPGLESLGIEYIKLAPVLIQNLDNIGNQALLRSIGKLGYSLGCTIVATGVEPNTSLMLLEELGVQVITGRGVQYQG